MDATPATGAGPLTYAFWDGGGWFVGGTVG